MLPGRMMESPWGRSTCKAMFWVRSENSSVRIAPRASSRADGISNPLNVTLDPFGRPSMDLGLDDEKK